MAKHKAVLAFAAVIAFAGWLPAWAGTFAIVYGFPSRDDGSGPLASLVNVDGTLYGTTVHGGSTAINGSEGYGTVFSLNLASGAGSVAHSFQGTSDGAYPWAGLLNVSGLLYGTTWEGGYAQGNVFSYNLTTGAVVDIYNFRSGDDGSLPVEGLIALNGLLYGATAQGGGSPNCQGGCGSVFSLKASTGQEKVLHSFQGGSDGAGPSTLISVGGLLYGTTGSGGGASCNYCGTVFSLNPRSGEKKVLYSFQGEPDGSGPGTLLEVGGLLYGTTGQGGATGAGAVFSVNPTSGAEEVLYSFKGGSDGGDPGSPLIKVGGYLYGTTFSGGGTCDAFAGGPVNPGCGTVFALNLATHAERVMHSFRTFHGGMWPVAGLTNVGGTLYGVTQTGGPSGSGEVFALKP